MTPEVETREEYGLPSDERGEDKRDGCAARATGSRRASGDDLFEKEESGSVAFSRGPRNRDAALHCRVGSGSRARHWQLLSRPLGLLSASWFAEACRFDAVFSSTGQTLRVGHAVRAAPAVIGSVEEADGRFLLLKIFPP